MHLIKPEPTDLSTLLEVIDFAHFEGKTTYKSFEFNLVKSLIETFLEKSLPVGTELLISLYLSSVDNMSDNYQRKVAETLSDDSVSRLFYHFDMASGLNKRLIQMCVDKGLFTDESQHSIVFTLMLHGKELQALSFDDIPSQTHHITPSSFQ